MEFNQAVRDITVPEAGLPAACCAESFSEGGAQAALEGCVAVGPRHQGHWRGRRTGASWLVGALWGAVLSAPGLRAFSLGNGLAVSASLFELLPCGWASGA